MTQLKEALADACLAVGICDSDYESLCIHLDCALAAVSAAEPVAWDKFPAYLIDHCEGETITEEGLQRALASMLKDSKYATPAPAVRPLSDEQIIEQARHYFDVDYAGWTNVINFVREEILSQAAQGAESAEKDAARYRWLRATWAFTIAEDLLGITTDRLPDAELDAAIDAAMVGSGGTGGNK